MPANRIVLDQIPQGAARARQVHVFSSGGNSYFAVQGMDFLPSKDGWIWATRIQQSAHQTIQKPVGNNRSVAVPKLRLQNLLYRTTDQGQRWQTLVLPSNLNPYGPEPLDFLSAKVGYMTTTSGLYRTDNGGLTWNPA